MYLYEQKAQYRELLDMLEAGDVDPQVIHDTLEALEGEIEEKLEGYACIIKQLEADAIALKTEEDRMAARRRGIEANIKKMKAAVQEAMLLTGKLKLKTSKFSMWIQKNPVSVFLADLNLIPKRFMVPQPDVPDKAAIKKYLDENGDQEWAQLQQSESLRIR